MCRVCHSWVPIEAVRPDVSRATISGARTGTGSAYFAGTTAHSLKAPYASSATGCPTLKPAQRKADWKKDTRDPGSQRNPLQRHAALVQYESALCTCLYLSREA